MSSEVQAALERAVEQLLSDETVLGALPEDQIQPLLDGAIARLERAAAAAESSEAFAAAFDEVRGKLRAEVMAAADETSGSAEPVATDGPTVEGGPAVHAAVVSAAEPARRQESAWALPESHAAEATWEDVEAAAPDTTLASGQGESVGVHPVEFVSASNSAPAEPFAPAPVAGDVAAPKLEGADQLPPGDHGAEVPWSDAGVTEEGMPDVSSAAAAPGTPAVEPEGEGLVEEAREALNRFGSRLRGLFGRGDDA